MADTRPLLDRIGARNVNIGLGIIYIGFFIWGLYSFLSIPVNVNQVWPIDLTFVFNLVTSLAHFGFIAIGATLVPNYVYYPVKPQWVYMLTDGIIFFTVLSVAASYLLSSTSSTVPLVATYVLLFALGVNIYKIYALVWGSARVEGESLYSTGA